MEIETCKVCNNFERKVLTGWLNVQQHRLAFDCAPNELLEAISTCSYCCILFNGIKQSRAKVGSFVNEVSRIYARGPSAEPPNTLTLEIYFHDSRPKLELEFFTQNADGSAAAKDVIRHSSSLFNPKTPLSEHSLMWVQSHIDTCIKKHAKCTNTIEAPLPTRLLHLSHSSEDTYSVNLEITKGGRGKYACMSHRWGGSAKAKTTRQSFDSMLEGISWDLIPQTFQDAIKFALYLGIEYIWIDAYCIIQDDERDWDAESERMAQVFQNSYITLAATVAVNNEAGCFWSKEDNYERLIDNEYVQGASSNRISVREVMRHWERVWTSNRESSFPLLTRAWVFQERILSARVLHFSHRELVWECMEVGDCQCGGFDSRSNAKASGWRLDNSWRSAVELYTTLKLTYEKDRLAAFHGFAMFYAPKVATSLERDYLAGLWRDSLRLDLLWRIEALDLVNSDSSRICQCWDTEFVPSYNRKGKDADDEPTINEAMLTRVCQYSYSAACSKLCLERRKLCRWGSEAASVRLDEAIEGLRCIDWQREETGVLELLQHEQLFKRVHASVDDANDIIPSWSWASAHQRISYWSDIVHVPSRYEDKNVTCEIRAADQGHIDMDGNLVPAILQYQDLPDPSAIGKQNEDGQLSARMFRSHDILKYGVRILSLENASVDLAFNADNVLCLEGRRFIPNRARVFLLHITRNAYLVLKEKWFFDLPCSERVWKRLQIKRDLLTKFSLSRVESPNSSPHAKTPLSRVDVGEQQQALNSEEKQQRTPQAGKDEVLKEKDSKKAEDTVLRLEEAMQRLRHQETDNPSCFDSDALTSDRRSEPLPAQDEQIDLPDLTGNFHLGNITELLLQNGAWKDDASLGESSQKPSIAQSARAYQRELEVPGKNSFVSFRRVGILRVPPGREHSLYSKFHWVSGIRIE